MPNSATDWIGRGEYAQVRIIIQNVKWSLHSQENTLFICIYQKKVVPLQYEK